MSITRKRVSESRGACSRHVRPILGLLLLSSLCGCGVDRTVTSSIADEDYRLRHPMVITHQNVTLDIFPEGRALDAASRGRIKEFADRYKNVGEGPVTVLLPQGSGHDEIARNALPAIRSSLAAGGVRGGVDVGVYPVPDPHLASPVRIIFNALAAKVESQCGQWPDDLASGPLADGWENHPYWNQGCAYQSAFAAQVADPRDLVSPRAEQPGDVNIRTHAIDQIRKGSDPGTDWKFQGTQAGGQIGQVGQGGG
ncbi:MAG TPA: CpaD family pilus assembly protein [Beijerinckiaceae bacterium]|nr:CpaD family pilus assembly protein [Beijerinckiaceae bacterium]